MLRIADYAQLQASRAPAFRNLIHPVQSPVSRQEWRVHASIKNITRTHDPHAMYVDADSTSASDFLRLQSWLNGLQSELDICWAVFGEVYGRQTESGLSQLGFFLRRVRSSIFDREDQFSYIPENISFKVAESEMLSLLLAPLYGNNPGYGIRELIQNAVDAVEEAIFKGVFSDAIDPQVLVEIKLTDDGGCLSVSDNGMGMTLPVVRDYFLNAGASFRSSMAWKRDFVSADGSTKVLRSGRFGVGALAAFLVGNRITVSTRHRTMSEGLHFEAALHDANIEIKRREMSAGTKVEIHFAQSAVDEIRTFFSVAHRLFQFSSKAEIKCLLLEGGQKNEVILKRSERDNFSFATRNFEFGVKLRAESARDSDLHYVNGIAVTTIGDYMRSGQLVNELIFIRPPSLFFYASSAFSLSKYSIYLTDRSGAAAINLARTIFTQADAEITDAIREHAQSDFMSAIPDVMNVNTRSKRSSALGHIDPHAYSGSIEEYAPST